MADLGNQLEGVSEGLERFLDSLDNTSIKLSNNAALEATLARENEKRLRDEATLKNRLRKAEKRRAAEEKTLKDKIARLEKQNYRQLMAMRPVYKKLWDGIKEEAKNRFTVNKNTKTFNKALTALTKGTLKGLTTSLNSVVGLSKKMIKGFTGLLKSLDGFGTKVLGGIGKGISAIAKGGLVAGLVGAVKVITDGLLASDAAMAKLSGRVGMTRTELGGVKDAAEAAQGTMAEWGVTLEQATAEAGNLVEQFGAAHFVTQNLVETSLKLQQAYGVAAEDAGKLIEVLERGNASSEEFMLNVGARSRKALVSSSLVMRDLASKSQLLSIYSERGRDALVEMAVEAAKAGSSLDAMSGMKDAFGDVDNIAENMMNLSVAMGNEFTKSLGTAHELFILNKQGPEGRLEIQKRINKAMDREFKLNNEGELVKRSGAQITEYEWDLAAKQSGITVEHLQRMVKETKRRADLTEDQIKAEKKRAKEQQKEEERVNDLMKSRNTIVDRLTKMFSGFYSEFIVQISKAMGVDGDLSKGVDQLQKKLKQALDLDNLAKDMKTGGWVNAIRKRIEPAFGDIWEKVSAKFQTAMKKAGDAITKYMEVQFIALKAEFPALQQIQDFLKTTDLTVGGIGKAAVGMVGVGGAIKGAVKVLGGVADGLSKTRGLTQATAMWVKMAGAGGGMMDMLGLGGSKSKLDPTGSGLNVPDRMRGPAQSKGVGKLLNVFKGNKLIAPLIGLLGKGGIISKGISGIGGSITALGKGGGLAKSLLRKIPFLGAGLVAIEGIGAGMDRLNATTEEQKDIANKQLAGAAGGVSGALIGGAIGTALLPGIGTAIGGAIGMWLGSGGAEIVYENFEKITGWFKGPIDSFKEWVGELKRTWDNIAVIAEGVWNIGKSAFNLIVHYANELGAWVSEGVDRLENWASELLGFDISQSVGDAMQSVKDVFTWENIKGIFTAAIPGASLLAESGKIAESVTGYFAELTDKGVETLNRLEKSVTGSSHLEKYMEEQKKRDEEKAEEEKKAALDLKRKDAAVLSYYEKLVKQNKKVADIQETAAIEMRKKAAAEEAEKQKTAEEIEAERQNKILGKILNEVGEQGLVAAVGADKAAAFLESQGKTLEKAAAEKDARPLTAVEKLIAEKEEKEGRVAGLLEELNGPAAAAAKIAAEAAADEKLTAENTKSIAEGVDILIASGYTGKIGGLTAQDIQKIMEERGLAGQTVTPNVPTETVETNALGNVRSGGKLGLVGEAGSEVVLSRDALRSGVGVSGKAASELASIGVPGYYEGDIVEGAHFTSGLMDALGSPKMKKAQAQAYVDEKKLQTEAMRDFWRNYYDRQKEEAGRPGDLWTPGSDGPGTTPEDKGPGKGEQFGDWVKYLFKKYPGLVDKSMQAGLSKAFKGEVPVLAGEMYKGVFRGMQAWSAGADSKEALKLGVMAGMAESLKEGGTIRGIMDGMRESNKKLMDAVQPGAMENAVRNLEEGTKAKEESDIKIRAALKEELGGIEKAAADREANLEAKRAALQAGYQQKRDSLVTESIDQQIKAAAASEKLVDLEAKRDAVLQKFANDSSAKAELQIGLANSAVFAQQKLIGDIKELQDSNDTRLADLNEETVHGHEKIDRLIHVNKINASEATKAVKHAAGQAFQANRDELEELKKIADATEKTRADTTLGLALQRTQVGLMEGFTAGLDAMMATFLSGGSFEDVLQRGLRDGIGMGMKGLTKSFLGEQPEWTKQFVGDARGYTIAGQAGGIPGFQMPDFKQALGQTIGGYEERARDEGYGTGSRVHMKDGGVVTKPTNALIGEAGPEAVIPLQNYEQLIQSDSDDAAPIEKEIIIKTESTDIAPVPIEKEVLDVAPIPIEKEAIENEVLDVAPAPIEKEAIEKETIEKEILDVAPAPIEKEAIENEILDVAPAPIEKEVIESEVLDVSPVPIEKEVLDVAPTSIEKEPIEKEAIIKSSVPLKDGGVVTRPTLALIGEAGAEAVIPLQEGMAPSPTPAAAPPTAAQPPTPTMDNTSLAVGGAEVQGEAADKVGGGEGVEGEAEGGMGEGDGNIFEDMQKAGAAAMAGGGAGGGGGGAMDAIVQILSMILQTNSGIAPQINGAISGLQEGLGTSIGVLSELLGGLGSETNMLLNAMGAMVGDIGTDLSGRMGIQIKHLSTIDTKVANHPSELQHKMKLTQGAAQGAGQEASSEAGKAPMTPPPVPGRLPGVVEGMAAMGGAKGGKSGVEKAWNQLEGAATGKYVSSPTLMMVGEEGRSEVVVPTERIRKGLPINKNVASELGSIGVPGFANGGKIGSKQPQPPSSIDKFENIEAGGGVKGALGGIWNNYKKGVTGRMGGAATKDKAATGMGGLGGMAKGSAIGGLMTGAEVFMQTGDWKQAGTATLGSGAGIAIGAGLTALGIPPPLSGMLGQVAGQYVTKGLNKVFGLTGGQKKGRNRTLKLLESHIKSRGMFDFGEPPGLEKWVMRAIGGKEKTPTEKNINKLKKKLGKSRLLATTGVPSDFWLGLGMGKIEGADALNAFKAINTNLYGHEAGDKYMRAVAVPQLADGGIVTKPTTAVVGEKGPEMVIPLHEQRQSNEDMVKELKKQNKLMLKMIETQKETGKTEVRLDGRVISETVGENFYEIGNGL